MIKNLILISLTTLIFGQNNRITNIAIAPKKMEYQFKYYPILQSSLLKLQVGIINQMIGII